MDDVGERLRAASRTVRPPGDPFERLVRRRERRRRRERLTALGVAAVVVVGALGGGLVALSSLGDGGVRPDEDRRVRPGDGGPAPGPSVPALGDGEYLFVKTTRTSPGGDTVVETWWAPDGSGRIRSVSGDPSYGVPRSGTFAPGEFPVESDVSRLSVDPAELALELRARSAPGGASPQPAVTPGPGQSPETGGLWRAVRRLLEYPNATPRLRAAIFEVAAGIPGVSAPTQAEDPSGRQAVALRLEIEGHRTTLFFDAATRQLTAVEDVLVAGGETVVTLLESGIVDSVERRPDGDEWLFPPTSAPAAA